MTTLFITDEQAQELGLDPSDGPATVAVLQDAADIYTYLSATPFTTRAQLDKWSVAEWGPKNPGVKDPGTVDRLNAALAVLVTAGRVFSMNGTLTVAQEATGA